MTEQSREYGEGLYALCAEEALSGDVLEELDVLNGSFKAQPITCGFCPICRWAGKNGSAFWTRLCGDRYTPMC